MHRLPLIKMLRRYEMRWPRERAQVARVRELLKEHTDCLWRHCMPGHITASAWVTSHDRAFFLLTHHAKLKRWLQLGGHVDGEPFVHRAALREAREESGMEQLRLYREDGPVVPLDIDIHSIPPWRSDSRHEHHDMRFLFIAAAGQPLRMSHESNDLRWFPNQALEEMEVDESVRRLGRKALALLC